MAARLNVDESKLMGTLKATVCKNMSDEEVMAYTVVCNEYNLNPFIREIFAFPAKGGGIVPVVSVDGWIKILNQHPAMDGIEFAWEYDAKGELSSCTSIIWRKDRSRPVKVTEYYSECVRNTDPWKMKHRMLRHKALKEGGRVAFGFSGIFDEDEARDLVVEIEPPKISVATAAASTPARERKPRTIEAQPGAIATNPESAQPAATPTSDTEIAERSLQDRLADLVTGEGCTFDHFTITARELNMLTGADVDAGSFAELSDDLCKRCLAAHRGLKTALKVAKEGLAK